MRTPYKGGSRGVARAARVPAEAGGLAPWLSSEDPEHLHVKDPVFVPASGALGAAGGGHVVFCVHSFAWTEGHSGHVPVAAGAARVPAGPVTFATCPRGTTWDVATARITGAVPAAVLARLVAAPGSPPAWGTVFFYDGAESFNAPHQHARGVPRPRGYCCEELGGALVGVLDGELRRLSRWHPLMVRAPACSAATSAPR